ncbi:MAG TPA: glycine cleavage T C-terminal barrel domain-containing protein [Bryobacteraceae bacterium]|nr:glycine cleavage T C-terminal barrel domain-containing protein [Bryobacteraceae bacterium]
MSLPVSPHVNPPKNPDDTSPRKAPPAPKYARSPLTKGYTALREAAAWRDASDRGRIVVRGDDRVRLLHAMTTNNIEQLAPGDGCYAFFLNAQGRILADANILCFADHILLDTEPETRTKVFEHLDRYIIADDVTLEDVTDRTAVIAVEGPQAQSVIERLGAPAPALPGGNVLWDGDWGGGGDSIGLTVARLNTAGGSGFFLIANAASKELLEAQLAAAGIPEAQPQDVRTVRIENGRPRYGEEITERYLVQETGQLQAVHFTKGCYLGQEIVERVRSRAQIHRGLRRLEIDTDQPPDPGVKLKSGETDAGEIASAAFSPALGKTVALAYVRTQFGEPGTELVLNGLAAHVR